MTRNARFRLKFNSTTATDAAAEHEAFESVESVEEDEEEEEADSCPVCLDESKPCSRLIPCGHGLCASCSERVLRADPRCPLCRQDVAAVDPIECGGAAAAAAEWDVVRLRVKEGAHAGLTLTGDGFGNVRVSAVQPRDAAHLARLGPATVILRLNGIPCGSHSTGIRIVEASRRCGLDVLVETPPLLGRRRWSWWWSRFFRPRPSLPVPVRSTSFHATEAEPSSLHDEGFQISPTHSPTSILYS